MSSEPAIQLQNLSKNYHIYARPQDRLRQSVLNFLSRHVASSALRRRLKDKAQRVGHAHRAVDDVSFTVQKGDSLAIIGRNGSGKSTILQLICGTLAPSAGSVYVHGRVAALLELGSGFNLDFTGRENVFLNGQLLGLSRREITSRIDAIAAFADIGDFFDEPVRTYSSGMFVRLAFSVIAHVDADILIVDEALAVGDFAFNQKCMRFLRAFMERGTLLFVTHDLASVKALCNRAVWLDRGRVRMDDVPREVADRYLQEMFESNQGIASTPVASARLPERRTRDPRADLLDRSTLRNDLVVPHFEVAKDSFGQGSAVIGDVTFVDETGQALHAIVGGERVRLDVRVRVLRHLTSPIVGFFVRDRLGQELFGDNTYLTTCDRPLEADEGTILQASFEFDMPRLPKGSYSILVAIAAGTQLEHVQHHWVNEAIVFESHTTSVAQGLLGIPMYHVALESIG